MSADYFAASLPPLEFDGPPPMSTDEFDALCAEHLGPGAFAGIEAEWRDLMAQMRNVAAACRAKARGEDPSRWRRPSRGISLFLAQRVTEAFREKDPAARQALLDRIEWDAAGGLVPPEAPLSRRAVFAYRVRLGIVARRHSADREAGDAIFERLAADAAGKAIPEWEGQ